MAIGTHFIVYERAVGAGPRDGGAAIGKWRDEEAGHNSMVPGGGIWWHYGHTVTYLHAIYSSTPRWWTDTAMLYVLFVNYRTRTTYFVIFRKIFGICVLI